ncbi:peptide-methionine (S)-S-oxide reductase MsrA [Nitrospinae bacterium AH_259_B05_G02_I21]|nr:peptide-methionine (S)-S-oxide reductase MsrA [Nitrospinae bacterium AH_259_B05_G02_I21]MDA2932298.1 peptide-methionine (S)-S-oxide reductase MsrA [Nitrospinae bacterium AH-259-F20]
MTLRSLRNGLVVALFIGGAALTALAADLGDLSTAAFPKGEAVATFAGGCFWCVESDFDKVPGVVRTISGYTGGLFKNPTYKQVSAGGTGHREAVQIFYDSKKVSYEKLLDIFWRSVDPTDAGGQFCDRGRSYETAIFANSPAQKRLAEASKQKLKKSGVLKMPIVTPIETAGAFYPAEDYHQDYYKKNPLRYKYYRYGCGRDARIREVWGKHTKE